MCICIYVTMVNWKQKTDLHVYVLYITLKFEHIYFPGKQRAKSDYYSDFKSANTFMIPPPPDVSLHCCCYKGGLAKIVTCLYVSMLQCFPRL